MNAFLVQTPDINILENVSLSSGDDIKLLSKRGIIKPKISLPPLGTFRFYFSKLSFFISMLYYGCVYCGDSEPGTVAASHLMRQYLS